MSLRINVSLVDDSVVKVPVIFSSSNRNSFVSRIFDHIYNSKYGKNILISSTYTFAILLVFALVISFILNIALAFFGFFSSPTFATTYSTSLTTSNSISLDVSSSASGASIGTDNLSVISNCPLGYSLSIAATSNSASFSDTTLYKDGDKTTNQNNNSRKINPSSGTKENPLPILGNNGSTSYVNTWGYSLGDPDTNNPNFSSNTPIYTPATINSNFIGLTNSPINLLSKSTYSGDGTLDPTTGKDTIPVYYGVSVDNTIEPGIYKMSDNAVITYYLTTSLDCTSYQVAFNPSSTIINDTTGQTETITGTGTMPNQRISEGAPTNLSTDTFTAPTVSGTQYYFKEWNTAQDGTGTSYTNGQSVTDLTTVGNTITLYAIWTDCPPNSICYRDNGANSPTKMGNQRYADYDEGVSITSNSKVFLWASNFQRSGYGFAGWSEDRDAAVKIKDTDTTNDPIIYGPNQTITIGDVSLEGMKLHAVWIESEGNLQNWSGCSSLTNGSITALRDVRDSNVYAVAKLADGNCWMIENSRLNDSASLDSSNTDNPSISKLNASMDNWCSDENDATCVNKAMLNTSNVVNAVSIMTKSSDLIYSYGNYYNWYAATAGRGTYSIASGNVSGSICPIGWSLPTGGSTSSDFGNLDIKLGGTGGYQNTEIASNRWRTYPNNFNVSGSWDKTDRNAPGVGGFYFSKSAYSNSHLYNLFFAFGYVYPATPLNATNKTQGFPVRCIKKIN